MKKLLLLLTAFALVMGLSQCRKPNMPVLNIGETQHVVLNASWDNGGSKIDQNGTLFKWTEGDKLYVDKVGGTSIGTLICKDPDNGTFEGYIIETTGNITFTFRGANYKNDFMKQTGALNDAVLLKSQELAYKVDGKYETVPMTMPHAVLLLDLSALGTEGGTEVTIKADGTEVASVAGVKNDDASKALYVAVKDETPSVKPYTFSGNGKVASCTGWELKANAFYTLNDAGGHPTGNAIVITPEKPKFSVSSTTTVEFSRGNLYYDGSSWQFEANQYDFRTYAGKNSCIGGSVTTDGTPTGHWGLFGWSTSKTTYGMSTSTSNSDYSGDFVDWGDLAIGGYEVNTWRTLSIDEWEYLLDTRAASTIGSTSDARFAEVKVNGVCGMMVFLDVFAWPSGVSSLPSTFNTNSSNWNGVDYSTADFGKLESSGAVFLPAAGYRSGTDVNLVGLGGNYWSSTPTPLESDYACNWEISSEPVLGHDNYRSNGYSVRLVR